jgi:hypothetical protein
MSSTITALTSGGGLAMAGDTSGQLELKTNNGTTAVTVTTAQNVGIGTTTPAIIATGHTVVDISAASGKSANIYIHGDGTSGTSAGLQIQSSTGDCGFYQASNIPMAFATNNVERMRLSAGGELLVGSSTTGRANSKVYIKGPDDNQLTLDCPSGATYTSLYFYNNGAYKVGQNFDTSLSRFSMQCITGGGVYLASGGTSWTSGSDERIKENLVPISDALNKVSSLRSFTGNYIKDETKTSKAFLIAQDVLKVLPEAVDTTNPDEYGLSYTDTIPLLVASIKELNAKVDAQALEIQALKGVA